MADRTRFRLQDILDAIGHIDALLDNRTFEDLQADVIAQAAFQRFLEIISEASRHIPQDMKDSAPQVPWRRVADVGNHLRHVYNRVDAEVLWNLHAGGQLSELRKTIQEFLGSLPA